MNRARNYNETGTRHDVKKKDLIAFKSGEELKYLKYAVNNFYSDDNRILME